jgi:hypothetical protein
MVHRRILCNTDLISSSESLVHYSRQLGITAANSWCLRWSWCTCALQTLLLGANVTQPWTDQLKIVTSVYPYFWRVCLGASGVPKAPLEFQTLGNALLYWPTSCRWDFCKFFASLDAWLQKSYLRPELAITALHITWLTPVIMMNGQLLSSRVAHIGFWNNFATCSSWNFRLFFLFLNITEISYYREQVIFLAPFDCICQPLLFCFTSLVLGVESNWC